MTSPPQIPTHFSRLTEPVPRTRRPAVIRTHSLGRSFGSVRAVDGIDLRVPEGGIYGFLGPNGAGKTTTIRMLLGLSKPDTGSIELFGEPLDRRHRSALSRVGALVETPSLYDHLSGRENLEVTRRLLGVPRSAIDRVLAIVRLEEAADRKAGGYSLGMRQRLGLALALLTEPELLILDEPTNGLDPSGIHEMRELISALPEQAGATVFLSSHHLSEIEQIADHLGIVRDGRLCFQGTLGELREKRRGRLVVGVDRPRAARTLLEERGWRISFGPGDRLHVGAMESAGQGPAELAVLLVKHGFDLHHLGHEQPSLESLFLHLTRDSAEEENPSTTHDGDTRHA